MKQCKLWTFEWNIINTIDKYIHETEKQIIDLCKYVMGVG